MSRQTLETDYLVVGCGAAGMAFADSLIADCAAQVIMVDRRHAPGGHWNEGYPFLRLHQPSAYYGVNSTPLGGDTIDRHGLNRGLYERASGAEICGYYDRVMQQRLLPSGQVRYFPMCDYVGEHRFVSRVSGEQFEVKVKKKVVDATYLQPCVPASTPPPFEVAPQARCVPVNELPRMAPQARGYVIIGAGKTAIDACLWLLEIGVPPGDIRWVKPREAWLANRVFLQGGELVGNFIEGLSLQLEAAARATSLDDLFHRLNAAGLLLRIDGSAKPAKYNSATVTAAEIAQLARIEDVVRLGHVRRIERNAIVLDQGTVPTTPDHLHVHCAARGLNPAPGVPMFTADRITLQPIRPGLVPFNAAVVGFVEATRDDIAEKNRLCPPNPLPQVPLDWVRGTLIGMNADYLWGKEPDIAAWLEGARLNIGRGLRRRGDDPLVQASSKRFGANARPGLARLTQLLGDRSLAA
jgi:hypothetical protein